MATSPKTPTSPPGPLDLSSLVQSARPAQLIRERTGATKTTLALELVKDREPHALGPVYVSQVKEIKADIRRSALKLDMGVAVQVQTLDGTKMPDSEVNDLATSTPTVQCQVVFQGGDKKVIVRRSAEQKAQDEAAQ